MLEQTLILVRHGATRANVSRPYLLQGARPDAEMVEEGIRQADAAARALGRYRFARVHCSPLRRALRTAERIAQRAEVPIESDEDLVEADVGLWSGLSWEEIERRWPGPCHAFHD